MLRTPLGVAAALLLVVLPAPAQTKPGLISQLPPDGTYALYDLAGKGLPDKPLKGTLRIASVGSKDINGVKHRWIEVRIHTFVGDKQDTRLGKFLIAEKAFTPGQSVAGNVAEAWIQASGLAPAKVQPAQAEEFLTLGGDAQLQVTKEKDTVRTGDNTDRTCKLLEGAGKKGDATLTYRVWQCPDVPFGVARINIATVTPKEDLGQFTATFGKSGTGAVSELKLE